MVLSTAIFISVFNSNVYTFSTGAPAGYTGAPLEFTCADGIGCHTGPVLEEGIVVTVSDQYGVGVTEFIPGETYSIQIEAVGIPSTCYGFQTLILGDISTNSQGDIIPGPGNMTALTSGARDYLRHTLPSTDGIWVYTWVADPFIGQDVTIYTSVNAANCNGLSTGDRILLNETKLTYYTQGCDIEWDVVQADPGILYVECNYGIPDTPRLELALHNFSGGTGNYTLTSPGVEFSQTTASPGDTVLIWIDAITLANEQTIIYVNDEYSTCLGSNSISIALASFPIDYICNNPPIVVDECVIDIAFTGDINGVLDIDDFYCENDSLFLSGPIDGPNSDYFIDLYQGYPGWVSVPGSFEMHLDADFFQSGTPLSLDISADESDSPCVSYNIDDIFETIDITEICASSTSVFDIEDIGLSIYPNPAAVGSEIRFDNKNVSEVELIDIMGRTIDHKVLTDNSYFINQNVSPGIYVIKATINQSIQTSKIKITR